MRRRRASSVAKRGEAAILALAIALGAALPARAEPPARVDFLVPEAPDPDADTIAAGAAVLSRLASFPVEIAVARDAAEARTRMAARPSFALVALPLYLEAAGADPAPRLLASPRRRGSALERWHVAIAAPLPGAERGELAGKRLAGTGLWEPRFLTALVLPPGAAAPELVPVERALQGIKMLREGAVDALLLSDPEREAISGLVKGDGLRVVYDGPELPMAPVVAFGAPSPREAKLLEIVGLLCADPDGGYLCEAFGIEGFGPPDAEAYRAALARYAAK